ncbi:MAG: DUF1553 domain-containing protein [Isosphaeraceae bacterium]
MRQRCVSSLVALLGLACLAANDPAQLEVYPNEVTLNGPAASQRLVVVGVLPDGNRQDLTDRATIEPQGTVVKLDERGHLTPVADGQGDVVVRVGQTSTKVKVTVQGSTKPRLVSFRHEINPALTKLGCNAGGCHGSQHGKGGLKLSLLGFETDPDYTAIVKGAEGRRLAPSTPEESLILLKPTLSIDHGGGKRMERDGREYNLIKLWMEEGAPAPVPNEPSVTALAILPNHRVMAPDEQQHLIAMATYDDGTVRDVTDDAKFNSLNEGNATVTPNGVAKAVAQGETNILVRYQGQAALSLLTIPYAQNRPFEFAAKTVLDEKAATKWRELGLVPSPPCTDAEFLRRAMLDTIGTTPTPDEVDAFLADNDPEKRTKLVDQLLDRPEYVDFWTLKWGDILRVNSTKLGPQGMLAFNLWLREAFRSNMPVNTMVEALVTAQGSIYTNGPANYFRVASSPEDLAETTAQVFMGVRLQCARCHHHLTEAYGQDDYYGLAAYFARIKTKNSTEFGLFGREQIIYVANAGEVRQPRSGKVMTPTPLNDEPADDPVDRRRALAQWLTAPDNPWLARNVVNRYWGYLFTKGLVNPIDDQRASNPASNPELLDTLASEFVQGGYDLKKLMRLILTSQVYSLSAQATPENRLDSTFFTHYLIKRLSAEQLLDAVNQATGTVEKFDKRPAGTRAISLPDPSVKSYFLDVFGRPGRAIACECERSADPTLGQALHLMNGDLINRKVSQGDGRLALMLKDPKLTDATLIQTLYKVVFARPATEPEVATASTLITEGPNRATGAQDLMWGLLNSKEFLFNH